MDSNANDTWDATRYDRYRDQRERPALDLISTIRPTPGAAVLDLGCGTGRLTARLHDHVGAERTVGIDSSSAMLSSASEAAGGGISFEERRIEDVGATAEPEWDVVFANASLQWVPDHEELLPRLIRLVRTGGQFAFQVPSNYDHPTHVLADEVGRDFGLEPLARHARVLSPARYAELLHAAGAADPDVVLRIYGHAMARTDELLDWVSGTLLTSFERRLGTERFDEFRSAYRQRLLTELGDPEGSRPYYYAFPRILCSATVTR